MNEINNDITDLIPLNETKTIEYNNIKYADIDNPIAQGWHNLSLMAQRIFIKDLGLASATEDGPKQQIINGHAYSGTKFTITSFLADWFLVDGGGQRILIDNAVKELSEFNIVLKKENGDYVRLSIYQAIEVKSSTNEIITGYSEAYKDWLKEKSSGYTRMFLQLISKIKNSKGMRWYTYLSSYRHFQGKNGNELNQYYRIISFSEIINIFQIKKLPKDQQSFRRNYIEEPFKSINKANIDLFINWEYLKDKSGGNRKRYTAVKIRIKIKESFDYKDIGFVIKVLGPSIKKNTIDLIIDNKERLLEIIEFRDKYRARPDYINLEDPINLNKIKTSFIEAIIQLEEDLKRDKDFDRSIDFSQLNSLFSSRN